MAEIYEGIIYCSKTVGTRPQVCFNEFGIQLKPSSNGFVKRFYKNGMYSNQFAKIQCLCVLQSLFLSLIILVLYKYGPLFGLWTKVARDKDRYGSLIKILVRLFHINKILDQLSNIV